MSSRLSKVDFFHNDVPFLLAGRIIDVPMKHVQMPLAPEPPQCVTRSATSRFEGTRHGDDHFELEKGTEAAILLNCWPDVTPAPNDSADRDSDPDWSLK